MFLAHISTEFSLKTMNRRSRMKHKPGIPVGILHPDVPIVPADLVAVAEPLAPRKPVLIICPEGDIESAFPPPKLGCKPLPAALHVCNWCLR